MLKIKQHCVGDAQKEQLLRRGKQRWMGWKSEKTILCYDHSFSEREEAEAFATFQHEVEQELAVPSAVSKQVTSTQEHQQKSQESPAVHQALADLAFWEDTP